MVPPHAPVFEALIVPHRSLTRKGVMTVIAVLTVFSAAVALRFLLLGAWPVAAFSLLEIPLVCGLLAVNVRRARASELIMLTAQEITVIQTDPAGRRKQMSLPSAWLRVQLDAGRGIPRVVLSSHGRDCEVGAFLHEPDRLSLFDALRDAVHGVRNPRFDNPQLRDD
ncbi:DUF2244 domain-containing protein [Acidisphaera sp. S103]|uniref:DUF2244 domain-containing protein n=1 Tax=Acidisphaera sp. S103 TaxID=1747223 RepID=UPI00210F3E0D|nr:DUF2244 domain-containing protein [Acidisphaera sp. S103]